MTTADRVLIAALEQLTSGDANRAGQLAGKAVADAFLGLTAGVDFTAVPPPSVVREGLLATPGTGLAVAISAGELLRYNAATAITADTSRFELARLAAAVDVALTAADPVNPRIDLIHATVTTADGDSDSRNILALGPPRTVTPTIVNKSRRPSVTLAAAAGTPGATPAFPATPAGTVALWYVYVPAAAVSITDGHLMDARRYLRTNDLQVGAGKRSGLFVQRGSTTGHVAVTPGIASTPGGGLAVVSAARDHLLTDVLEPGASTPAADEQVDVYVVARGAGAPVGKGEPDGAVIVATADGTANPPTEAGGPTAGAISYLPLQSLGLVNVIFTTAVAAYLGTIHIGASAGVLDGGVGHPLDRGGRVFAAAIAQDGGFGASGWLRPPELRWQSVETIRIRSAACVLNGVPAEIGLELWDITTDIAAGEAAEANSTWYHLYFRLAVSRTAGALHRAPVRRLVPIMSSEGPDTLGRKVTPEAGFVSADYLYAGAVYNDSGGDLLEFWHTGRRYIWASPITLHSGTFATSPTRTNIQAIAPAHARMITIQSHARTGGTGAFIHRLFSGVGATGQLWDGGLVAGAADFERVVLDIGVDGNQQFEGTWASVVADALNNVDIRQSGWIDPLAL